MVLSFREQLALAITSALLHLGYNRVSARSLVPRVLASGLLGQRATAAHAALSEAEKRKFLNYWTSLLHSSVVSAMFLRGLPAWLKNDALSSEAMVFATIPLSDLMFPISCG